MMTVYGRPIEQKDMDAIAIHMDDEIREQVHFQLAPCTPDEFLAAYLEKDPDFEEILKSEFGWKEDDDMTAYVVVEMERTGTGNVQNYIFDNLCDAMDKARDLWLALSREESKYMTVCVCEMPEDADPDDLDDGNVIWEDGQEV